MIPFDIDRFVGALSPSRAFTPTQVDCLAKAIAAALSGELVPGESHEAPPLRGPAADLS